MLDAAARIFSRRGYHEATVDEIAEAAGISKPMVYLYFGSKEDLFVAVVQREAGRLNEMITDAVAALLERAVTEAGAPLPPEQDLIAIGHTIVGGCEALADWMLDADHADPAAMARRAMDLAWLGLSRLFQIPPGRSPTESATAD